jgi:hypothetical protein
MRGQGRHKIAKIELKSAGSGHSALGQLYPINRRRAAKEKQKST